MLNAHKVIAGTAVPSVDVNDLKRVWMLLSEISQPESAVSSNMLRERCSTQADALAVYVRATMIKLLFGQGLLREYQAGNTIPEELFQKAAVFPLPNGLQNADLSAFISELG